MPDQRLEKAFRRLRIGVVVASAVLSGLCGWGAGYFHGSEFLFYSNSRVFAGCFVVPAGIVFGVLAGIGAGLYWSHALRRKTINSIEQSGRVSPRLILYGVGRGCLVGIAATAFLHAVLTVLTMIWRHIDLAFYCQIFGVPAGLGLGLICGFVWWLACRAALRKSREEPAEAAP